MIMKGLSPKTGVKAFAIMKTRGQDGRRRVRAGVAIRSLASAPRPSRPGWRWLA